MARVLVADDDPLLRELIRQCLEHAGHTITTATDGRDAISKLRPGAFDVLVTDHNMPGATGLEVIIEAQRVDPKLASVIVTAYHDLDLAMRAMAEGAAGFLPKPFRPKHLVLLVARALERRQLAEEALRLQVINPMLERFTTVLANTIEAKDVPTHGHCERLARLSEGIAMRLGVSPEQTAAIKLGACLHDVGKIAMPEHLLRKPSGLEPDEMAIMRRHPEIGASILESIDAWEPVRLIVRHHHEMYDGTGYPDGLAGNAIPLGARIVAVADAFDVMREGRPYSAAKPITDIIRELRTLRGRQFDPDCVDAFLSTSLDAELELEGTAHAQLRATAS
jgi:putative two-component system response regulator